jgi:hypothetical protein
MKVIPAHRNQKKPKPNLHGPFSTSPTIRLDKDQTKSVKKKNATLDDSSLEFNKDKEEERLDEEEKENIQEQREREIDKSYEDDDENEKRERTRF